MAAQSPHHSRLSLVLVGLVRGRRSSSRWPGDQIRSGYVQVPAGGGPRGKDPPQGRVFPAAAGMGKRTSRRTLAADRGRLLGLVRRLRPRALGSVTPSAATQGAAEIV